MRLFSKSEVDNFKRKENEELLDKNGRLRNFLEKGIKKLNTLQDNYEPEKLKKQKEFEDFVTKINLKKDVLLKELKTLADMIEKNKEIVDSIMDRQDALDEREYIVSKREENVKKRENFIKEVESKMSQIGH